MAIDSKALEEAILRTLGEHRMLTDDLLEIASIRTELEKSVGPKNRHLWHNFLQVTLDRLSVRGLVVEHLRVSKPGWEKVGRAATRRSRRAITEAGRCSWCARMALECICDEDPFLSEI